MIRLAIPMFGGRGWMGGFNYLETMLAAAGERLEGRLACVVLAGDDADPDLVARLAAAPGAEIQRSAAFASRRRNARLAAALATGVDGAALAGFRAARADLVFETAEFFGWRWPLPTLAWMPDFQHRRLPTRFPAAARLRRELGFTLQASGGRTILLSSEDARADCERFYPAARGRTAVARFAPRPSPRPEPAEISAARVRHGLPERYLYLPNQLWTHKDHATAFRALALARAAGSSAVLVLSGEGADPRDRAHVARLAALAEQLGLGGSLIRLGLIPGADVKALLAGAAALVNPSLFEGWSTTVEEAKAFGAPMILSDLPVHREQASEAAAFFPPGDAVALAQLMADAVAAPVVRPDPQAMLAAAEARFAAFAEAFAAAAEHAMEARR